MRDAAMSNLKKVTLELGGKSPNIVFADCPNLDRAVEAAVGSIFFNQGESCNAPSRLFVEASIKDAFLEKALKLVPNYQPGNPLDKSIDIGAMVSPEQLARVRALVDGCEGGVEVAGGAEGVDG